MIVKDLVNYPSQPGIRMFSCLKLLSSPAWESVERKKLSVWSSVRRCSSGGSRSLQFHHNIHHLGSWISFRMVLPDKYMQRFKNLALFGLFQNGKHRKDKGRVQQKLYCEKKIKREYNRYCTILEGPNSMFKMR